MAEEGEKDRTFDTTDWDKPITRSELWDAVFPLIISGIQARRAVSIALSESPDKAMASQLLADAALEADKSRDFLKRLLAHKDYR